MVLLCQIVALVVIIWIFSAITKPKQHNLFSLHITPSGAKKIPCPFWNPYVYCHVHKESSCIFILNHMNPIHTLCTLFFRCILILFSYLHLGLLSGTFFRRFPSQLFMLFPHRPSLLQASSLPLGHFNSIR
jgi:hypothetical protein